MARRVRVELGGRNSVQGLLALYTSTSHSSIGYHSTSSLSTSTTSIAFSPSAEVAQDGESGEDVMESIKGEIDQVTEKLVKNIETEVKSLVLEKTLLEQDRGELKRRFDILTSESETNTKKLKIENQELKKEVERLKTENSELRAEGLLMEDAVKELEGRCEVSEAGLARLARREQEKVVEVQVVQERDQVNQ